MERPAQRGPFFCSQALTRKQFRRTAKKGKPIIAVMTGVNSYFCQKSPRMIRSMTGYGKAEGNVGNRKFTVELKSLNSKQLDLNVRMPSLYKEKEMSLRKWLADCVVRGKVDLSIYYEADASEKRTGINQPLMEAYHEDLKAVADRIGQSNPDYMSMLMRIPDVMRQEREELDENEWKQINAPSRDASNDKMVSIRSEKSISSPSPSCLR